MTKKASIITISDGVSEGFRADGSGDELEERLGSAGFEIVSREVVADEEDQIRQAVSAAVAVCDLVVTTGGTGLGPRDVTPEAVEPLLERRTPGINHLLMSAGLASTPMAALSRAVSGAIGSTLVVTLPGSRKAVSESLDALLPVIDHALDLLAGDTRHDR